MKGVFLTFVFFSPFPTVPPSPTPQANNSVASALGQPPQKRHAIESKVVSGAVTLGGAMNPTPTQALYSYGFPMQQHPATAAAPAYYQGTYTIHTGPHRRDSVEVQRTAGSNPKELLVQLLSSLTILGKSG